MHVRAHTLHKHIVGICDTYQIWQYINMVIEYRIMMLCFMSIEMVICMSQKIAAHDLTFL